MPLPLDIYKGRGGEVSETIQAYTLINAMGRNGADPTYLGGVKGDTVSNDSPAINNMLQSASPGETVKLPYPEAGSFGLLSPLYIPPAVTLEMTHAPKWKESVTPAYLRPLPGFSGSAVIRFLDREEGGYSMDSSGQRLVNVTIDGHALTTGTTHGIQATGDVTDVKLERVSVFNMGGRGIKTDPYSRSGGATPRPIAWSFYEVVAAINGYRTGSEEGYGFDLDQLYDSDYWDCLAINNNGSGVNLGAPGSSIFHGFRSEWNGVKGFRITGWFNGKLVMIGCSTDRNQQDGIWFGGLANSSGGVGVGAVQLVGFHASRDGKNGNLGGGNWAGIAAHECLIPVVLDGCSVHPGVEDDGAGALSPHYALRVKHLTGSTLPKVHIAGGGVYWGASGVLLNDGNARIRLDTTVEGFTGAIGSIVQDNTFNGYSPARP